MWYNEYQNYDETVIVWYNEYQSYAETVWVARK